MDLRAIDRRDRDGWIGRHGDIHAREYGFDTAIRRAVTAGSQCLDVATYDSHRAACRPYRRAGFESTGSATVTAYGQHLVERRFSLELADRRPPAMI